MRALDNSYGCCLGTRAIKSYGFGSREFGLVTISTAIVAGRELPSEGTSHLGSVFRASLVAPPLSTCSRQPIGDREDPVTDETRRTWLVRIRLWNGCFAREEIGVFAILPGLKQTPKQTCN